METPLFPTTIPGRLDSIKGVNWKAVLLWGLILGALVFAVYWYRDDIAAFFGISTLADWQLPNVDGAVQGVVDYVNKNPITVVVGAIGAVSAGLALYERVGKMRADTAKTELEYQTLKLKSQADAEIQKAYKIAEGYKTQAENAATNTGKDLLAEAETVFLTEKTQWERDKANLQGQVSSLKQTVKELKVAEAVRVK